MARNQEKLKQRLLENLAKVPNISVVCENLNVSRATFYRWRLEDAVFDENVNYALEAGREVISDLCESQIIKKIQEGDNKMIIYYLSHNNQRYKPYTMSYREKRIQQMPLVQFQGPDGKIYDSFEEYSIGEKERIRKIIEDNKS